MVGGESVVQDRTRPLNSEFSLDPGEIKHSDKTTKYKETYLHNVLSEQGKAYL